MPLNKQKGNMYPFVTHTWNTVKGECPHSCTYCYMKRFKQSAIRFDEYELKTDLGAGNFIFVGSSCDLFANGIPFEWIGKTLEYCNLYLLNQYLFQSKNPGRIYALKSYIPVSSVIGTTMETNLILPEMGRAPSVIDRAGAMMLLKDYGFKTMITIEPIMDFELSNFLGIIESTRPDWVNIGADSQNHKLPEPKPEKVKDLIKALSEFTEVKIKKNLNRIVKGDFTHGRNPGRSDQKTGR